MYKQVNGTYDYLPLDCYAKDKLASGIMQVFTSRGYRKIETPVLERYNLFDHEAVNIDSNKLFKLIDSDGSILVMRPDMTLPIARIVTTKLTEPLRNKYCYVADSFTFKQQGNDIREFTQAGVELFAPRSSHADADMITMSIECMLSAGLRDFIIDIGHVGFIKGLLAALNLPYNREQELVRLINAKDSFGIELFAQSFNNNPIMETILSLPSMFGGKEVISNALSSTTVEQSVAALTDLSDIITILETYGYDKYISIDLSLVNGISYYSGVVFKGMSKYLGTSVLGGGRYDNLTAAFGKQLDATGFAIGVNNLLEASRRENANYNVLPSIDILIGGSAKVASITNSYINEYIAKGLIVENSYIDNVNLFTEEVARVKAKAAVFINDDGTVVQIKE